MQDQIERLLEDLKTSGSSIEPIRPGRWFVHCQPDQIRPVCNFLFERLGLRFVISTGVDGDNFFEVLHHFCHDPSGSFVTVKVRIPDRASPSLDSISPCIPAAEWIEREMQDLLGIRFIGHPDPKRLILADDWPEGVYPLRKDYKP